MTNFYKKLARHLDKMPAGFPATDSGVEVKILERLFTQDEADIVLGLNMWPESVPVIAQRLSMDPERLGDTLMAMSQKGLIFRTGKDEEDQALYDSLAKEAEASNEVVWDEIAAYESREE